ncbi:MAG TPA: ROK family protein [Candidatus Dormibacteraeota bacterium]|nr:ROK family protein [Candidatus Dormibacteraeota bacterium]
MTVAVARRPVAVGVRAAPGRTRRRSQDTLTIDVGGTGIKAEVLDSAGKPRAAATRVKTEYPLSPSDMIRVFKKLAGSGPEFDRVSVGFPGVVRAGVVLSAPHFIREGGEGTAISPPLERAWSHFNLARAGTRALGRPVRVGNDAEVQGLAVIKGKGLEVVVTLGTAFGSAVFQDGVPSVHLELAHHPCHGDRTYSEYVGDAARSKVGNKRWNRRVLRTVETVRALLFFDHLYVGGGNSTHVRVPLGDDVTLVDNAAGLLGGIRLWEPKTRRRARVR